MSRRRAVLEADAVYLLSRAEWDRVRRRAYLSGMPRDDALWPKLVPPGGQVLRAADRDAPALDTLMDPRQWEFVPRRPDTTVLMVRGAIGLGGHVPTSEEARQLYHRDRAAFFATYPVYPDVYEVTEPGPPDFAGFAGTVRFRVPVGSGAHELVMAPVGTVTAGRDRADCVAEAGPEPPSLGPYVATQQRLDWIDRVDACAARTPLRPRDGDPVPIVSDEWWYDTPWGRERVIQFVPPFQDLTGLLGRQAPELVPLPEPGFVFVRDPHPLLGDDVPPGPVVTLDLTAWGGGPAERRRAIPSAFIAFAPGPGHQYAQVVSAEGASGWIAVLDRERSHGGLRRVYEDFRDMVDNAWNAVRTGDLEAIGVATLGVIVSGPVGLGLLGSDKPWRDAARLGAVGWAFAWSPLTRMIEVRTSTTPQTLQEGGQLGAGRSLLPGGAAPGEIHAPRLGATEVSSLAERRYVLGPGIEVTPADIAAAEVIAMELSALAPHAAQSLLEKIALEGGGFIDLVFARLVVEGQKNEARREALLQKITAKQAEYWERYGQWIALAATVLTVVAGPLVSTLAAIAESGLEAGLSVAVNNALLALERGGVVLLANVAAKVSECITADGLSTGARAQCAATAMGEALVDGVGQINIGASLYQLGITASALQVVVQGYQAMRHELHLAAAEAARQADIPSDLVEAFAAQVALHEAAAAEAQTAQVALAPPPRQTWVPEWLAWWIRRW